MQYMKKPEIINAIQWNGENANEISSFCGRECYLNLDDGYSKGDRELLIKMPQGYVSISIGDFIVKDIGGFYKYRQDVFEKTYEEVEIYLSQPLLEKLLSKEIESLRSRL